MGIKFGEIDASQILENEYKIKVLEKIVETIVNENIKTIKVPSSEQLQKIREEIVLQLQKKYPNSGIKMTQS